MQFLYFSYTAMTVNIVFASNLHARWQVYMHLLKLNDGLCLAINDRLGQFSEPRLKRRDKIKI